MEALQGPLLVIGHAEDKCIRLPPDLMRDITARITCVREKVVTVTGCVQVWPSPMQRIVSGFHPVVVTFFCDD